MSPRRRDASPVSSRERILDTTAALFRRHGYNGTGLKQIVSAANAPFGSVYHHFPGGKEQLGGEVIRRSGRMYEELLTSILDAEPDLLSGIAACFAGAAAVLAETDYIDACPIETVALEVASTNERLRLATAEVFTGWIDAATARLRAAGIDDGDARPLAMSLVALLEGAFVLCRSLRSVEPLAAAGDAATAAVRRALAGRADAPGTDRAGRAPRASGRTGRVALAGTRSVGSH